MIGILLGAVTLLLGIVILTPIVLSSQDLIAWAAAGTGLNLSHPWPLLVAISLDSAAGACVLLSVYSAWRGDPAGIFGVLVWGFALGSAFANFRHSSQPGAAPDAIWFFPLMSIAGPALLEAVLGRFRRWIQRQSGRRNRQIPAFGWRRWTPGLGAPRDTYGAYRTALLLGIDTVDTAITTYHQLCPDGSLRVAAALRELHAAEQLPVPEDRPPVYVPVDLMRRIPANADAYQRWRTAWADLTSQEHPDLAAVAARHHFSKRQIEWVRRAGQLGFLDSPVPPAYRLAGLTVNGARPDSHNNNPADHSTPS
ncbi:DUF2637 domain-containing protein [Actinoplanes sp. NBC_00393]|uniref:DUF2637 domain-containing protein n=1 Tax=Actinoplanes sp. NBC_00393 TaxID=2975953 RepID=UPI002E1F3A1F